MSGITSIPRWLRTSSASGVVGAFAPSATIFAFTAEAFSAVITDPVAAGIRTSQSSASTAWEEEIPSPPAKPLTPPVESTCRCKASMSSPLSLRVPPVKSATAMTFAPSAAISAAATEPTFPKPWTAMRSCGTSRPSFSQAAEIEYTTPLPVASRLPTMPPRMTGFPVTKQPRVMAVPPE